MLGINILSSTVFLGNENPSMATGEIELEVETVESVVSAAKSLPFYVNATKYGDAFNEQLRMTHRYLDLRRASMQRNIRFRAETVAKVRQYLTQNGFLDIETPTLFRRTPGTLCSYFVLRASTTCCRFP